MKLASAISSFIFSCCFAGSQPGGARIPSKEPAGALEKSPRKSQEEPKAESRNKHETKKRDGQYGRPGVGSWTLGSSASSACSASSAFHASSGLPVKQAQPAGTKKESKQSIKKQRRKYKEAIKKTVRTWPVWPAQCRILDPGLFGLIAFSCVLCLQNCVSYLYYALLCPKQLECLIQFHYIYLNIT